MSLIPAGTSLKVETRWLPPITAELGGPEGPPPAIVRFFQPRITLIANGTPLTSIAPAGDPTNHWPLVRLGLLAVGVLGVIGLLRRFV